MCTGLPTDGRWAAARDLWPDGGQDRDVCRSGAALGVVREGGVVSAVWSAVGAASRRVTHQSGDSFSPVSVSGHREVTGVPLIR